MEKTNTAAQFLASVQSLLNKLEDTQAEAISKAADLAYASISSGKKFYLLGSGHSHMIAEEMYAATPEGARLAYDEGAKYAPVIEQQFLRGGLRLAALLTEIYK